MINKFLKCLVCLSALFGSTPVFAEQILDWDAAYALADAKMKELSLSEKLQFTRGYSNFYFFGLPEKGIPPLYLSDATQGVHIRTNLPDTTLVKQLKRSTAFPCPIMLTATFNPTLAWQYAEAVGEECRAGGIEVLLGPGVNITKNSQCGRNFEYMGEDPFLSGVIASNYVKGIQSTGTAACLKHFICNETEFYRRRSNSVVDERALHEIYMVPFKAGIDAGAAYVMTAYNKVNGEWAGQSDFVIKDLLRGELGFKGSVMSDWTSVYDTEKMVKSGQNTEMPGRKTMIQDVIKLMQQGKLSEADIDAMIRPVLATGYAFGLYDREKYKPELLNNLGNHVRVASDVAAEGVVLLKNSGILPLQQGKKVLLTGKWLDCDPRASVLHHPSASAEVEGYDHVSLKDALGNLLGNNLSVIENPTDDELKSADVVILSAGTIDVESFERPFALPGSEEAFIKRAVTNNPNTVILVFSGSGIRMTGWNDDAAAVIYGWYPGQCGMTAIADILTGSVNPSGKLPLTIEREFKDSPAKNTMPQGAQFYNLSPRCYNEALITPYDINYEESVLVGYRWYDKKGIKPLYPFGHGLSYTTFQLTKPTVKIDKNGKIKLTVTIKNTGNMAGAEVVQIYTGEDTPTVLRPTKELKAFDKVKLAPGEKKVITFELNKQQLAFWNDKTHAWQVNPGNYTLSIGTSAADIAHQLPITIK
jgi:beta-glucosidase